MNKIKQLWFPLAILAIIVLTVGWVLAMVVYPSNVQSNEQVMVTPDPATATAVPTEVPTSTPSPILTATVANSTPTPTPATNCTHTMEFWRKNTDAWLIENIVLGNLSYTKIEVIAILESEDPGPIERLMAAFFTALLNTLHGADSAEIDSVMVEARDWLILRPHGIDLSETEILEIEGLAEELQEYNNGTSGPGLCSDESPTPTPEDTTITPTQEITPTSSATSTSVPGATFPAPTRTATKDSGGKPKPTKTLPPPPTNTQPPPPTSTPQPTLVPPTPAPTQPPPTP